MRHRQRSRFGDREKPTGIAHNDDRKADRQANTERFLALTGPKLSSSTGEESLGAAGGNQALGRAIQAKLEVGAAGDRYEQEADRIADQVVARLAQRQPVEEEEALQASHLDTAQRQPVEEEEEMLQASHLDTAQRQPVEEEEEMLQASSEVGLEGGPVSADTETAIHQAKGRGKPLDDGLRTSMEQAFGTDFSDVRVHADHHSTELNHKIQAKAFTTGSDIFVRSGDYDPTSTKGQRLLAHELTHVVQQRSPTPTPTQRTTIQRLPATVFDQDPNWSQYEFVPATDKAAKVLGGANNISYKRSAAGAKGGVFFLSDAGAGQGEVRELVVKPLYGDVGGTELAETFLAQMDISAPNSRVVQADSEEAQLLLKKLPIEQPDKLTGISIMEKAPSDDTLQKRAGEIVDEEGIEGFFTFFAQTPNLIETIGRMAPIDSVMGNFDRFTVDIANYGNLIFDVGAHEALSTWAIDNEAAIPRLNADLAEWVAGQGEVTPQQVMGSRGLMRGVIDDREQILGQIANALSGQFQDLKMKEAERYGELPTKGEAAQQELAASEAKMQQLGQLSAKATEKAQDFADAVRERFNQGFDQGVQEVLSLFRKQAPVGEEAEHDRRRGAVKETAQQHGMWSGLKANVKYLEMRSGEDALSHEQAAKGIAGYVQYRTLKESGPVPVTAPPGAQYANFKFPKEGKQGALLTKVKGQKSEKSEAIAGYNTRLQAFKEDLAKVVDDVQKLRNAAPDIIASAEQVIEESGREADPDRARVKSLAARQDMALEKLEALPARFTEIMDNARYYSQFATAHARDVRKHVKNGTLAQEPGVLEKQVASLNALSGDPMPDLQARATTAQRRLRRIIRQRD